MTDTRKREKRERRILKAYDKFLAEELKMRQALDNLALLLHKDKTHVFYGLARSAQTAVDASCAKRNKAIFKTIAKLGGTARKVCDAAEVMWAEAAE